MNNWNDSLQHHYESAQEKFGDKYKIVCVSCKGSQNYRLDTEDSDFDSICLVVPTLYWLVREPAPISTTLMLSNGEQMKVKDLRTFCREFAKSWNYWEVFTSDYAYWDDRCSDFVSSMRKNLNTYARITPYTVLQSFLGVAIREYKNMKNYLDPARKNKCAMKVLHFSYFAKDYFNGSKSVEDMVKVADKVREHLLEVKAGKVSYTTEVEQALRSMEELVTLSNDDEFDQHSFNDLMNLCQSVFETYYKE